MKNDFGPIDLVKSLLGTSIAVPYTFISNTIIGITKLPNVILNAYKALFKTDRIGPNLKVLGSALIPPIGILSLTATSLATIFFGIFRGCSMFDDLKKLPEKMLDDNRKFSSFINKFLGEDLTADAMLRLPNGEAPIDIKIIETLKSALMSIGLLPFHLLLFSVYTAYQLPALVYRLSDFSLDMLKNNMFVGILTSVISAIVFFAIPPLYIVGSCLYVFAAGAIAFYKRGIASGISETFENYVTTTDAYKELLQNK